MKVYLLYDYDEDGPNDLVATTDIQQLRRLLMDIGYTKPEHVAALYEALDDIRNLTVGKYRALLDGWGNPRVQLVEVEG